MNKVIVRKWVNPSCPDSGQREIINLNFYYLNFLWCLRRFYESLKGPHKTFRGTKKKCENKNLSFTFLHFYFNATFEIHGAGRFNML